MKSLEDVIGEELYEFTTLQNVMMIEKQHQKFAQLAVEILKYFECERCARCCKIPVGLSDDDITILHKLEGDKFFDRLDGDNVANYLKAPCQYLKGNECTVYDNRPSLCRVYPFSLSYPIPALRFCPMGKKIYEELKKIDIAHKARKKKKKKKESKEKSGGNDFRDIVETTEDLYKKIGIGKDEQMIQCAALSIEGLEMFLRYLKNNVKKTQHE